MHKFKNDFFFKDKSFSVVAERNNTFAVFVVYGNYSYGYALFRAYLNSGIEFLVFQERKRQVVIYNYSGYERFYFPTEI